MDWAYIIKLALFAGIIVIVFVIGRLIDKYDKYHIIDAWLEKFFGKH
jgi:hypothetical protein